MTGSETGTSLWVGCAVLLAVVGLPILGVAVYVMALVLWPWPAMIGAAIATVVLVAAVLTMDGRRSAVTS